VTEKGSELDWKQGKKFEAQNCLNVPHDIFLITFGHLVATSNILQDTCVFDLFLVAFVERSPNADLSRVSWDGGPSSKVATPIWLPRSRGETNDIITKPCAVHFF